jgi:hypothetical protein
LTVCAKTGAARKMAHRNAKIRRFFILIHSSGFSDISHREHGTRRASDVRSMSSRRAQHTTGIAAVEADFPGCIKSEGAQFAEETKVSL